MNTRQYYYLTTIGACGNLSRAAQALGVSPSALSKFLAECERSFGFALFLRYGRRLYPTAVGRFAVECAQKILDEQRRMLLTMKAVMGRSRRQIRLATAPNRGAIIYSKIYRPFSRRYPDVALSLTELLAIEQPAAIARGQIDLALGAGPASPDTADIPVAHEELLVCLPAAHPLAGQEAIRLDSLRDTPFVLPVRQTLHLRYPLSRRLSEPERYLAALLAEERLVDPRYQAADSPFVRQLLEEAAAPAPSGAEGAEALPGPAPEAVPEINLDSKTLEYLAAIVEEQSLSRAAERFYLAQSALSRTLHHVEEMVGLPLFSREHNRLRPTAAGAVFVNSARNILRIEREMFERTRTYRAGRGGHLYLSCDPLFSAVLHEKVEPAFRRLHPELSLVIAEQDRAAALEALGSSSADLGVFLATEAAHPPLLCETLALTELVYRFALGGSPAGWQPGDALPAGFQPRPQLLAERGSTLRGEQEALLAQLCPAPPPPACEASFPLLRRLAALGVADSILPLHLLPRALHAQCAAFDPPRPLYLLLARHPGRALPAAAADLQTLIRQALDGAFLLSG